MKPQKPGFEVIKHRAGHSQLIGYARVSKQSQTLDSQLDALRAAGCCRVYCEKVSGASHRRPAFEAMRETLRKGDTVVVAALDRLGRRLSELVRTLDEFREQGVHFRDLRHGLCTSGPHGKLALHMLMVIAECERDLNRERTREGLVAARARGREPGRPTVLTPAKRAQIAHLRAQGFSLRAIADAVDVAEASVRKALAQAEKDDPRQLRMAEAT